MITGVPVCRSCFSLLNKQKLLSWLLMCFVLLLDFPNSLKETKEDADSVSITTKCLFPERNVNISWYTKVEVCYFFWTFYDIFQIRITCRFKQIYDATESNYIIFLIFQNSWQPLCSVWNKLIVSAAHLWVFQYILHFRFMFCISFILHMLLLYKIIVIHDYTHFLYIILNVETVG